jgi:hypothetical protein
VSKHIDCSVFCFTKSQISARAQSERKAMLEIINDSLEGTEEEKEQKVNALIKEAEKDLQPSEKGKVRDSFCRYGTNC